MKGIDFARLLRTRSSERFMLQRRDADIAALDIDYLENGTVHATLIAFEGLVQESEASDLLAHIDERLLPR